LSRAGAGRHGAKDPRREVKPAARAGSSSAGTSGGHLARGLRHRRLPTL